MADTIKKWKNALKTMTEAQVFAACSTEEFFLRQAAETALPVLQEREQPDITRIEGPFPDLDALVAAAGTISFFSGRRVVWIDKMDFSAMQDGDVKELCGILKDSENAVFLITVFYKDDRAKTTKKAKLFWETAETMGLAADFVKPQPKELSVFLTETAKEYGAALSSHAAADMLERCGSDLYLLENEVAKLAARSGYTEITSEIISEMGTRNIEADVFEMIRFVTDQKPEKAFEKLHELFYLQNEPIAIAAALSGSFIDLYRVKMGAAEGKGYQKVFADLNYKGNDYRLKRAGQTAAAYSLPQLERAVLLLEDLDLKMKSSPMDQKILLEAALGSLCTIGGRKTAWKS